jgi:hypothetical protein
LSNAQTFSKSLKLYCYQKTHYIANSLFLA